MKAVMLAAGLGTRLGRVTDDLPKCMVEVAGVPILHRNLEWAATNGITEVAVNLHYRSELVTEYFHNRDHMLPIHWSYEPRLLGTAGTVHSLGEWIGNERFAVIYADNLINCNFDAVHALHQQCRASATVALFQRDDVSQSGVAELDESQQIVRFVEKPRPDETPSHWVSAGLLMLEPEIAQLAPVNGDIGRDLLPALLADNRQVVGYRMSATETLHWIDTPDDLARTRAIFEKAIR